MGAKLTIIPVSGASHSLTLAAGIWQDWPEMDRKTPHQALVGYGVVRALSATTQSLPVGTLTLRLTGSERATFHSHFEDLAEGGVLRVFRDSALAPYTDVMLAESDVEERYKRLFPGSDGWFLIDLQVVIVGTGA